MEIDTSDTSVYSLKLCKNVSGSVNWGNIYCVYLDEEVDGESFCHLDALLLHQLGIRMGPAVKLQKLIRELKVRELCNCYVAFV